MSYLGDIAPSQVLDTKFTTVAASTGAPTTLSGSPAISVYKTNSTTESTSGITLTADFDSVTGLNHVRIDTSSDGTFYAAGGDFQIVITTGTVGGTSAVGYVVGEFSINNRTALRPATAGRTLVVDSAGLADANTVKLGPSGSGTAQTARDVGASVLLSSGTGTGQLDFTSGVVKANLAQILGTALTETAGQIAGGFKQFFNIASPTSTMNTITTVTTATNLTTNNDKTGYGLSSAAVQAIWDALTSALTTSGSIGKLIVDNLNATITSVKALLPAALVGGRIDASVGAVASGAITNAALASDTGLKPIRSNTAQAGASTSITLDAGADSNNSFYNNCIVLITGGTGVGQARYITAYNGTTKVATVTAWTTNPDNTSTFAILPADAIPGATAPTAAQNATAVWTDLLAGSDFSTTASIGKLLKDNVDAAISTRLASSSIALSGGAVTVGTNNDKTGYGLSSAAVQAIWDATTSALTTAGSIGKLIVDNLNATITSVKALLPAALVGGRMDSSVGAMASGVITRSAYAADTGMQSVRSNTAQSGAGSTITLDASASSIDDLYNNCLIYITGGTGAGQMRMIRDYDGTTKVATITPAWITNPDNTSTFAVIASASVWDEITADHTATGQTGNSLNAAGSAGDPWATALPGSYGAGTAGKIIGDNINATVSSRLAASSITLTGGKVTVGTNDDKTGYGLSAAAVQAVWDAATSALTTVGSIGKAIVDFIAAYVAPLTAAGTRAAVGLASANLDTQLGGIDTKAADIQNRIPAALTAGGNMKSDVLAISGDTTAADNCESFFDGTGYAGTNNVMPVTTAVTNDVGITQAGADKVFGASGAAMAELTGVPSATPSPRNALMLLFMALCNKLTTTATEKTVYNNAGSAIAVKDLADDGTTYTEDKMS